MDIMKKISEFDAKGDVISSEVRQQIAELDPRVVEQMEEEQGMEGENTEAASAKVSLIVAVGRSGKQELCVQWGLYCLSRNDVGHWVYSGQGRRRECSSDPRASSQQARAQKKYSPP